MQTIKLNFTIAASYLESSDLIPLETEAELTGRVASKLFKYVWKFAGKFECPDRIKLGQSIFQRSLVSDEVGGPNCVSINAVALRKLLSKSTKDYLTHALAFLENGDKTAALSCFNQIKTFDKTTFEKINTYIISADNSVDEEISLLEVIISEHQEYLTISKTLTFWANQADDSNPSSNYLLRIGVKDRVEEFLSNPLSTTLNFSACESCELPSIFDSPLFNKLEHFYHEDIHADSIDFSKFPKLKTLRLGNCQIGELDLSLFPDLEILDLNGSTIAHIDFSTATKLTTLKLDQTSINCDYDLRTLVDLRELYLPLEVEEINLVHFQNLQFLCVDNTHITHLDLTPCSKLTILHTECNLKLKTITFPLINLIEVITCGECEELESLYIEKCKFLKELKLENLNLKKLQLNANEQLIQLIILDVGLKEIDLFNAQKLKKLFIKNVPLKKLDLRNCTQLKKVNLSMTKIASFQSILPLKLSNFQRLKFFNLFENHDLERRFEIPKHLRTASTNPLGSSLWLSYLKERESLIEAIELHREVLKIVEIDLPSEDELCAIPSDLLKIRATLLEEEVILETERITSTYESMSLLLGQYISIKEALKSWIEDAPEEPGRIIAKERILDFIGSPMRGASLLNLSDLGISNLPNVFHLPVFQRKELKKLDISKNPIDAIDLSQQTHLEHLIASKTNLSNIDLSCVKKLQCISLANCHLEALPIELIHLSTALPALTSVILSGNIQLREMYNVFQPDWITFLMQREDLYKGFFRYFDGSPYDPIKALAFTTILSIEDLNDLTLWGANLMERSGKYPPAQKEELSKLIPKYFSLAGENALFREKFLEILRDTGDVCIDALSLSLMLLNIEEITLKINPLDPISNKAFLDVISKFSLIRHYAQNKIHALRDRDIATETFERDIFYYYTAKLSLDLNLPFQITHDSYGHITHVKEEDLAKAKDEIQALFENEDQSHLEYCKIWAWNEMLQIYFPKQYGTIENETRAALEGSEDQYTPMDSRALKIATLSKALAKGEFEKIDSETYSFLRRLFSLKTNSSKEALDFLNKLDDLKGISLKTQVVEKYNAKLTEEYDKLLDGNTSMLFELDRYKLLHIVKKILERPPEAAAGDSRGARKRVRTSA